MRGGAALKGHRVARVVCDCSGKVNKKEKHSAAVLCRVYTAFRSFPVDARLKLMGAYREDDGDTHVWKMRGFRGESSRKHAIYSMQRFVWPRQKKSEMT